MKRTPGWLVDVYGAADQTLSTYVHFCRLSKTGTLEFRWIQSDVMWAMRCLGQSTKVQAASTVLKMQGQGRVAKKLQVTV